MQISRRVIGKTATALVMCACGTAHTFRLGEPIQVMYFLCDCGEHLVWMRYPQSLNQLLEMASKIDQTGASDDSVF